MSVVKWLCPAILAFLTAPAQAITPEQAQTLPVTELARMVLGEVGSLVVDVERPKWPTCEFECAPLTEEQLKTPPPLTFGLAFYTRPLPASVNEKWAGLCTLDLIAVPYDQGGKPMGFGKSPRWAAPNGMKRVSTPAIAANPKELIEAESRKCAAGADPRTFFVSDDGTHPFRVLVAAEIFAEAASRGARLPFGFKCKSDFEECEGDAAKSVAERFRSANIRGVEQVDCRKPDRELSSSGPDACYNVDLRDDGESLFLELVDADSDLRIRRIRYRHGMVVY